MDFDIDYVAELAKLPLSTEEKSKFANQIQQIVAFVAKLNEIDTDQVEPTFQVTGKINEARNDQANPGMGTNESVKNAQKVDGGLIVTKGVFHEE